MIELFSTPFVIRALIAALLVGSVCGYLGIFVVLRKLAFVGDGIAHSAFAGIALAYALGLPQMPTAFVFCSLVAALIALTSGSFVSEDTSIGIFFAASMALGILLFSVSNTQVTDIVSVLFGSILQVTKLELLYGTLVLASVVITASLLQRQFMLLIFDEELAYTAKVPVLKTKVLLFILIALSVVSAVRLVGTVLVSALLISPAATALIFAKSFKQSLVLSTLIGALISVFGLVLAVVLDLPPSAIIALLSSLVFLSALFLRLKR